ncbi:MAG: Gfo/Idh/MocA family oxidoreductase [Bacteroidales bacterium]
MEKTVLNRRDFLTTTGAFAAGAVLTSVSPVNLLTSENAKRRMAVIGTGVRAAGMWIKPVIESYGQYVEFVGLCDINPGRVETVKKYCGLTCPTFTSFETMMAETKPDTLIVTSVDATHHQYIVRGMELGADIITEKPMTTDEDRCQEIIDAERRTGKKVIVTFNYRYSPHRQKLWELLRNGSIGKLTSVDFHWYLDVYHGADYFRRWHRLREKSGTLLVHKATHHFDLLNWWIDSDPVEVFATGNLELYGANSTFRGEKCRGCQHAKNCPFFWDITKDKELMALYVDNEKYDNYYRDGCVFREDINIFDKMAATIKYANKVHVSYSLTTYSPYEGYRIAFNGTKGRLEAWIKERQPWQEEPFDEIHLTTNFGKREIIKISNQEAGHGGGDERMKDKIFLPDQNDPYRQSAGVRDGAFSILIGIAARKSIYSGQPVSIAELTDLVPMAQKV